MTDDTIDEAKLRELMKEVEALPRSTIPIDVGDDPREIESQGQCAAMTS